MSNRLPEIGQFQDRIRITIIAKKIIGRQSRFDVLFND